MVEWSNKHLFWQALLFTIVVFGIGMIFGFALESYRADKSEINLMQSEINLLDEQIRAGLIEKGGISCELGKQSIFAFANKIYNDAVKLDDYTFASKFRYETLTILHKRYDLLRMILWNEAIELKKICDIHTIVYFFVYGPEDSDIAAKQKYYSRMLLDLRNKYPDKILLIPIAANLDISSVNLAMVNYGIKAPVIFADEKTAIDGIITAEELEKAVFG